MDADVIAEYEKLQKQATALKRMKRIVDAKLKDIQPKIVEYSVKSTKDNISTPGGGKIVVKPRPTSISSITFKQMPNALQGLFADQTQLEDIVNRCKTYMTEQKKAGGGAAGGNQLVEYLLPHPNLPGKTIQQKDIALQPIIETKILEGLDKVMNEHKLQVCEPLPRKRTKSAGPSKRAPKKTKKQKQKEEQDQALNDDLDTT